MIRRVRVAPFERDPTDHRSVEIDHKESWAPAGYFGQRPFELVARSRTTDIGAHLWRREQVDDRGTVPGLGLTEQEAFGPDRGGRPGHGSEVCHVRRLTDAQPAKGALQLAFWTREVASFSHLAYALGNAERCTRCAATVTAIDSHPGTRFSAR